MGGSAERENTLLRAALFLVAAGAAEGRIETIMVERLLEPFGLPHVGMQRAMVERVDAAFLGFGIVPDEQFHTGVFGALFAQLVHFLEFPGCIDMQQREGRRRGIERLLGQVQHHGAVLTYRIEHHRLGRFGGDFAHDVDAFCF